MGGEAYHALGKQRRAGRELYAVGRSAACDRARRIRVSETGDREKSRAPAERAERVQQGLREQSRRCPPLLPRQSTALGVSDDDHVRSRPPSRRGLSRVRCCTGGSVNGRRMNTPQCSKGHELVGRNLSPRTDGTRRCRLCDLERRRDKDRLYRERYGSPGETRRRYDALAHSVGVALRSLDAGNAELATAVLKGALAGAKGG